MENLAVLEQVWVVEANEASREIAPRPRRLEPLRRLFGRAGRGMASGIEWLFGLASLMVALSSLAALPILQFLSLGYFLESSGRVARTGRLRDGFIGVRRAARVGGLASGI